MWSWTLSLIVVIALTWGPTPEKPQVLPRAVRPPFGDCTAAGPSPPVRHCRSVTAEYSTNIYDWCLS
jgi:hypothetical protein